jgi:protein-arginine kinase activator protein McsA
MCGNCIDATFSVDRFGEFVHAFLVPSVRKGQCPQCGTTDAQAKKSGLVGCPICYLALSDDAIANPFDAVDSDT